MLHSQTLEQTPQRGVDVRDPESENAEEDGVRARFRNPRRSRREASPRKRTVRSRGHFLPGRGSQPAVRLSFPVSTKRTHCPWLRKPSSSHTPLLHWSLFSRLST